MTIYVIIVIVVDIYRAILVISGLMEHVLEEEAGTKEYVYPGHLVGEYGLINEQTRSGTLSAIENCNIY